MIPPDQDIFEVEQRIAARRAQLKKHAREAGTRTLRALASPAALIGAAAIGFFAASAVSRRQQKPPHPERRKSDHTKAAKATGLAGIILPAAMWFVRANWGSPINAAQAILAKFQSKKVSTSPRHDTRRDTGRIAAP